MYDLRGRVAIVTGGAVRLGRAMAERLAREGMDVCVHYSSSEAEANATVAELQSAGVRATSIQADFRSPSEAAERVVTHAARSLGRVDVLVNSASIFETGTLSDTDADSWDRHLDINLKTPALLCRAFAGRDASRAGRQIVNILDWRAERPTTGHLAYTVSKSGLASLTRILAQELAPNVRVNAIAPGAILPGPGDSAEDFAAIGRQTPMQRTGTPDDIADALVFLLRSEFVTGEILHVTGGQQL